MDFGIALPTAADNYKVVQRAEELGFTHAWFYDTQMLSADCFVAMGAAAVHTKRIRLGTGVLVPSNRIAPVSQQPAGLANQPIVARAEQGDELRSRQMADVGGGNWGRASGGNAIDTAVAAIPVRIRIRMRRPLIAPIGDIDRPVRRHGEIGRSEPFVVGLEQIAAVRRSES